MEGMAQNTERLRGQLLDQARGLMPFALRGARRSTQRSLVTVIDRIRVAHGDELAAQAPGIRVRLNMLARVLRTAGRA